MRRLLLNTRRKPALRCHMSLAFDLDYYTDPCQPHPLTIVSNNDRKALTGTLVRGRRCDQTSFELLTSYCDPEVTGDVQLHKSPLVAMIQGRRSVSFRSMQSYGES